MIRSVSHQRIVGVPTCIYGLVDPRTDELRYIGKTVRRPSHRLFTHQWLARTSKRKSHVQAWLANLLKDGREPEVVVIEIVPAGVDWVEAEQFWIAYFRMIGADLCNLTIGGDGSPGRKHSPEEIEKRVKRGAKHHMFGKKMSDRVREALASAGQRCRSDPNWVAWAGERRRAGMTPDRMEKSIAGLRAVDSDPIRNARRAANLVVARQRPEVREKIGAQSRRRWAEQREKIIAAQNAGKGAEWKAKHRLLGKNRWNDPDSALRRSVMERRKLSDDDVRDIRVDLASGVTQMSLANKYRVDASLISRISKGTKRTQVSA